MTMLSLAAAANTANKKPVIPTGVSDAVKSSALNTSNAMNGASSVTNGNNSSNSNADLIRSMYENNLASGQQATEKQRQIQQQGLNGQETNVNQNALQNLNNNDAMANTQLKKLQEVMANNGVRGGDNITATIGNQTAQQQGANQINQDKANQLRDISEKRSLINNNASADDLALLQKLQATRSGQMIDNNNTQQNNALQLAQLMGKTAGGQNTLGGNQLALQQQGQGFNQNLQSNQFGLQQQNQNFNEGMANKQFNYQKVQDDVKNGQWSTATENSMKQWAEGNKLNWAQFDQNTKQALAQIAIGQQNANTSGYNAQTGRLSEQNNATNQAANLQLNQEKFKYDSNPDNMDNQYKKSEINWRNSEAAKNFAAANKGTQGADEYDLLQVNSLAEQAGINATTSPTELKTFVAGLKSKYGWDLGEAQTIEGYLTKQQQDAQTKAAAAKAAEKPKGFGYRGFGG